jgi:four helix bundle protein
MLAELDMAHKVEELEFFGKAQEFCEAVTATLNQSRVRKDSKIHKQITDANDSIVSNIDEGFEQESDDGFAKFLYYSKGSVAEVMRRLRRAAARGDVAAADVDALSALAEPLGRMMGGFIKYLKRSGFKDRGRFRASQGWK